MWTSYTCFYSYVYSCVAIGVDIFPSEHSVRAKTSKLMYDYVSGTVNVDGDAVSFIRVTNIKDVIESTLRTLHKNKHMVQHGNIPAGEAWVVLQADKGSSGTTLGLQILNRQVR